MSRPENKNRFKSPSYGEISEMLEKNNIICNPMPVKIMPLYVDAKIPQRQHATDSGMDLFAYSFDKLYTKDGSSESIPTRINQDGKVEISLSPLDRVLVNTGISATVGFGYEIQIRPRSGLALKRGLTVLNTPGTVDEAYRGPIKVILVNLSNQEQTIAIEDRIAQMVVAPVILSSIEVVKSLDDTARGDGGFGHTGV